MLLSFGCLMFFLNNQVSTQGISLLRKRICSHLGARWCSRCVPLLLQSYCELVIFLPALSDLKFADIPNGVQALYKMPAEAAWWGGMCRRVLCFCASASGNLEPSLARFHGEPGSLHAVNPQTIP